MVTTPHGDHFETERLWERHRRHGCSTSPTSPSCRDDLLDPLSGRRDRALRIPRKWAFLDTETTGLAGGTGTYAFLIGVGRIDARRLPPAPVLHARLRRGSQPARPPRRAPGAVRRADHLQRQDVRPAAARDALPHVRACAPPFDRMQHLDLLFGARRLWKLRLDSCRLVDLENQILGVEREGDLPGEMIPYCYFDFLRSRRAFQAGADLPSQRDRHPVAGLPDRHRAASPSARPKTRAAAPRRRLIGLARWLQQAEQYEALPPVPARRRDGPAGRPAVPRPCGTSRAWRSELGRHDAALAVFTDLAVAQSVPRPRFEELAKHYEHREKNYAMALEMTRAALDLDDGPALRKREQRLKRRAAQPKPRRLLLTVHDGDIAFPGGSIRDPARDRKPFRRHDVRGRQKRPGTILRFTRRERGHRRHRFPRGRTRRVRFAPFSPGTSPTARVRTGF